MRKGFTLLETVFAVALMALVMGGAMGSWMLFMYKSHRVNMQASLDMDVRKVIERFRTEMRNTARESIIFYPESEPYAAVGFALAADLDGDGLMDMENGGSNILWRQTVVYHVWNHSPHQMRRTLFSNRNREASYDDRFNQVASVVTSGDGAGACLAGESAESSVLFENLFTGKLWHAESRFDGYAPQPNTREKITFGSLPLGPGEHIVNLTVLDKNPRSSGWKICLDQVSASVAAWPLEAELRTASGVEASSVYVGQGLAGAGYGLAAATASDGDTISLTVYNDAIEECAFIGEGRNVAFSNTVVRFDDTYTPSGFQDGVYVAKLDGQFKTAWWGSVQAENAAPDTVGRDASPSDLRFYPGTNCAIRIPVRGEFVRADGYGPVFRMYKSAYNGNLRVLNPAYASTDTPGVPNVGDTNLVRLAFYQNGTLRATWSECAAGGVELRPITGKLSPVFVGQHFIFSYQMVTPTPNNDSIRAFRIADENVPCWVVKGGDAATAMQPVWTSYEVVREKDWTGNVKPCMPGLVCMVANFADDGDYFSHVYDTQSTAGSPKSLSWEADVPAGASLAVYARSGDTLTDDGFGIADAADWENVAAAANGGPFSGSTGRYVQFRAAYTAQSASQYPELNGGLGSAGPFRSATPKLRRVLFTWDGEEKYVDVTANLLKGPDCGIFKVDVDGKDMIRGVTMEIEIFKDVRTQGGKEARLHSTMTAEVDPRNSGK